MSIVARLDMGWHAHPKILSLGLQAMGLHAWSISYCDATRSDGFIPHGAWPALPGVGASVKRLLDSGLWERCDDGFRLHDYLDYNRSRAKIAELGAVRAAAGRAKPQQNARKTGANGAATSQQFATPGPGPGPGLISSFGSLSPGGSGGDAELPPEVLDRLSRPPIDTTNKRTNERISG